MRHMIGIALLALALGALSACSGVVTSEPPVAPSPSPTVAPSPNSTWTPAPRLTADPESLNWDSGTDVSGGQFLLPDALASSDPFTLPAGPAMVAGFVAVNDGSAMPPFTVQLVPVPNPASFEGYRLVSANWFLPEASKNEAAVNGWFPYALPAGRYSLVVRQTGGDVPGMFDAGLHVAGVK